MKNLKGKHILITLGILFNSAFLIEGSKETLTIVFKSFAIAVDLGTFLVGIIILIEKWDKKVF